MNNPNFRDEDQNEEEDMEMDESRTQSFSLPIGSLIGESIVSDDYDNVLEICSPYNESTKISFVKKQSGDWRPERDAYMLEATLLSVLPGETFAKLANLIYARHILPHLRPEVPAMTNLREQVTKPTPKQRGNKTQKPTE